MKLVHIVKYCGVFLSHISVMDYSPSYQFHWIATGYSASLVKPSYIPPIMRLMITLLLYDHGYRSR